MPTTTTGLILAISFIVLSALWWWIQRRAAPTPEQRADDRKAEINALFDEIAACDAIGDFATADALRRRLCELQAAGSKRVANEPGQRLPGDAPGGDKNSTPE